MSLELLPEGDGGQDLALGSAQGALSDNAELGRGSESGIASPPAKRLKQEGHSGENAGGPAVLEVKESKTKPQDPEQAKTWKKCSGHCGLWKSPDQYNSSQGRCKPCVLGVRQFWRLAQKQNCKEDLSKMEQDDSKLFSEVQKAFMKERSRMENTQNKIRFNIIEYKDEVIARCGDRKEVIKSMMWEGEWMEAAKTAAHGYLTPEEATSKWKTWKSDPAVKSDHDGPRGFLRLAVPTRTNLVEYEEFATGKRLDKVERLNKNAKDSTIDDRLKLLLSENHAKFGSGSLQDLREKAQATGVDLEDMAAPHLADLTDTLERKRKRRKKSTGLESSNSEDDTPAKEDGSAAAGSGSGAGAPGGQDKVKWFDAETKCRKAERDWVTGIEGLEKAAELQSKEAIGVLESFRALPDASRFSTEMSILGKRVSWLQAIQEGDQAVEKLIEEADKEQLKEDGESDKKAGTTSDDVEALARAGPCHGYQALKSFYTLKAFGLKFRSCKSAEEIKAVQELGHAGKKQTGVLSSAVKIALSDLQNAKKRVETQKKKEEEKEKKAKAKAQTLDARLLDPPVNAARRKSANAGHALLDTSAKVWDDEGNRIPSSFQWQSGWGLDKPWIISNAKLPEAVGARLGEFGTVFASSSLRVTEGRAHCPMSEELTSQVHQMLQGNAALRDGWLLGKCGVESLQAAQAPRRVKELMKETTFGIASSSSSIARFELDLFPCLRVVHKGSMQVALWAMKQPKDLPQQVELVAKATQQEVANACTSGSVSFGTIGPGDCLYIPPGCLVTHLAHSVDVLGVRLGVLHAGMADGFQALLDANPGQQARGPLSTTLQFLKQLARAAAGAQESPLQPPITNGSEAEKTENDQQDKKEDVAKKAAAEDASANKAAERKSSIAEAEAQKQAAEKLAAEEAEAQKQAAEKLAAEQERLKKAEAEQAKKEAAEKSAAEERARKKSALEAEAQKEEAEKLAAEQERKKKAEAEQAKKEAAKKSAAEEAAKKKASAEANKKKQQEQEAQKTKDDKKGDKGAKDTKKDKKDKKDKKER
ncbi:unnamed protein product [Effrenium voratum]|uniref:Uncharacterized protein n=1 Tax=Effrenium voratum TaxID=2562239 RepID=A0AA36JAP8_9DINO|nr:unnamed protein product [Effrenium voratum]